MSYVGYLFAHSGVQHILCCVFCFVCRRLVYPMLSVSLYCLFLICHFGFILTCIFKLLLYIRHENI